MTQDTQSESIHSIFNKQNGNKGYHLYTFESGGQISFDLCNGTTCSIILNADAPTISPGDVFNVTVVYDKLSDNAQMVIYQKGVGGVSTITANNLPFLVNDNTANYPMIGDEIDEYEFEGILDELRVYNRALSNSEIWALQSQGAN
jgi:hypothetical protein